VIVIAHRLKTIERADDLLILEQGQIVEYGSRTRLMADPSSRLRGLHRAGISEVLV
jgi:ABC-type multidrug transport system fused ATPase/permease subunit